MERLVLAGFPTLVDAHSIPYLCWRDHLLEVNVNCKSTVWPIEADGLPIRGTLFVSINVKVQKPFDVVVYCHVLLLRHVSMAFVTHLETIILYTNFNTSQVVRPFQESP